MAKQYSRIEDALARFIARQRIFFVASASAASRVNVSPRSTSAFRCLSPTRVAYLDLTGSGNETSAHIRAGGAMTVMFCALEGPPMILRLYGRGGVHHRGSATFVELLDAHFEGSAPPGARQIVTLDVDLAQTSCGYGVPLFDHRGERDTLDGWARRKGEDGLETYRREKNLRSIDALPTGLLDEDEETVIASL